MATLKFKPGMVIEWWCDAVQPFAQRHAVVQPTCANAGDEERKNLCRCSTRRGRSRLERDQSPGPRRS